MLNYRAIRRFSTTIVESYVPNKLPAFTNGSFKVYECRPETMKLQKYMYYPLPFMGMFGSYMVYKTVYWTGFLPVFLPTFPLAILFSIRKNISENCEASIMSIDLLPSGQFVKVRDVSGKTKLHPITSLRKATDNEIIKINRAGGPAFVERMKDFYPVMVSSSKQLNADTGKKEIIEVSGNSLIDVLFIDNKGNVADKPLLSAILNG